MSRIIRWTLAIASVSLLLIVAGPSSSGAADLVGYRSGDWRWRQVQRGDPLAGQFADPSFDDSSWPTARAGFGFGTGCPIDAYISSPWSLDSEMLLRRVFQADPANPVTLHLVIDNDALVWVNGVQVMEVGHENCPNLDDFAAAVPAGVITSGDNVLAVRAIDRGGASFVDMRVEGTPSTLLPPSNLTTTLACPPRAVLAWHDNSQEDRFEIEMETDGAGVWAAQSPAPAGSTTWASSSLAYGHDYRFRIRACNGGSCSGFVTSAPLDVSQHTRLLEGTVRATVIDRGPGNNPSRQPLPGVRVSVVRGGQPIASSQASDADGYFQIGLVALACDDSIAIRLVNDDLEIEDRQRKPGTTCEFRGVASKVVTIPPDDPVDIDWPVGSDGVSGDAPNAWYWVEREFADFWKGQLGLTDGDRFSLRALVGYPEMNSFYYDDCPQEHWLRFGPGYARFRSAMAHEFAHSMLHKNAGLAARHATGESVHPAAGAIDEALADYFTAASSGNTEMFPRPLDKNGLPSIPVAYRNITSRRGMGYCDGGFVSTNNLYNDALVLSGALWDWRKRLVDDRGVQPSLVDQAVLDGLRVFVARPAASRGFVEFRSDLANTGLGTDHADDLTWAFDRHNIKVAPDETCLRFPLFQSVNNWADGSGRHVDLAWSSVPGATGYRVYESRSLSGFSVGLGEVVALNLTDTTFTYVEPNTGDPMSFTVVVLDSAGEEGTASLATPVFVGVESEGRPVHSAAWRAYPNPARGGVRIECGRALRGPVSLEVYDLRGRRVRGGRSVETPGAGVAWDGLGDDGRAVGTGIYMIRVRGGGTEAVVPVVILR